MRSVLGKLDVLVEEQQELIITRNLKDFKNSDLSAMTARQFIETI